MTDTASNPGTRGVQLFSAPSDAPRIRLRGNLIAAGVTSAELALLILVAGDGSTLDDNTLQFVGTLPGWLLWMGQAAYVVGVAYAFGMLVGVGALARHRLELLRDMLLAAALAVVGVVVLTQLIDRRWPEFALMAAATASSGRSNAIANPSPTVANT